MFFKYTDKEIKELLSSLIILIDSREQKNSHIIEYLSNKNISYEVMKLDYSDYSIKLPINLDLGIPRDMYFTDVISIERKGSLEELSGNFTKDRLRIENEFIRSRGKIVLLVENCSYEDIINWKYNTKYRPESFIATLKAFESRYNLQTNFVKKAYAANFIYYTLYYAVREVLGPLSRKRTV